MPLIDVVPPQRPFSRGTNQRGNRSRRRHLSFQSLETRRVLATYFVDAIDGDDLNTGDSQTAPWASLSKLESTTLEPGDEVFFRRGSTWDAPLTVSDSGTASEPITFGVYGDGQSPILQRLTVRGGFTHFEELTVDRARLSGDAVRVRNAHSVVLRDMVVRNGTSDGIDATDVDGLLIDGLHIHHFLNGSFTDQRDAHGIVIADTRGVTIRNTDIHHVSGDSFQADPDRDRQITTDILIEDSHFWTNPLEEDFNDLWFAGQRPGENAVDTKVVKDDWESAERMKITIRNVLAHGWVADGFIGNRAAFNMKEKIEAVFDGVTVYDSEIGFRLRGSRGNANVTIQNAVMHDLDKAIRAEDDLANLNVYHSTFGDGITRQLQFAGGDGGRDSWDVRNNAFLDSVPGVASDPSNRLATPSDFLDVAANDYQLSANSTLIDAGVTIETVSADRDGTARPQGPEVDVGAYEAVQPNDATAPQVEDVMINDGGPSRSSIHEITVTFDRIVELDELGGSPFRFVEIGSGQDAAFEQVVNEIDGQSVVSFTFLPGDTVTEAGSLADGNYELHIDAALVTADGVQLDGNADGTPGDDFQFGAGDADDFFRKFGDTDGDGTVNILDFAAFRAAFGSSIGDSGYRRDLDADGDGAINLLDFAAFRSNFGS